MLKQSRGRHDNGTKNHTITKVLFLYFHFKKLQQTKYHHERNQNTKSERVGENFLLEQKHKISDIYMT